MRNRRLYGRDPHPPSTAPGPQEAQIVAPPQAEIAMPPGAENNPIIRGLYPEHFRDPQMQVVNQPGCDIPNPDAEPTFDRTRPYPPGVAAERLGFQNQEGRLFDLPRGDSGAGQTSFRRIQTFERLDDEVNTTVCGNVAFRPLPIATQRSSDQRLRFWHVSIFGTGVIEELVAPRSPLAESEIMETSGFVGVESSALLGVTSSLVPFIPRISLSTLRVMIHDESGQRFWDTDCIGTRSFDVYAWSVAVFALVPVQGYEVTTGSLLKDPNNNAQLTGLVQDSIIAARVVPIALNTTNNIDQRTICVGLNGSVGTSATVPIPPGAKTVTIINHGRVASEQLYRIDFDAGGPRGTAATTAMGAIILDPVTFRTPPINIPNSTKISFQPVGGAAATSFSLVFDITS